jgi:ubiquinone/menaquinone biosynthesis C-methylase UbiE
MKHHATRLMLNKRVQSTVFDKAPTKVLDLGTGTGIWAIDFGKSLPKKFRLNAQSRIKFNS